MLKELQKYHERHLVYKRPHTRHPLYIWNYTPEVQYDGLWDDITIQARGLVTDDEGNIVARPFKKFWNLDENRHISSESFEVFEKIDGSCIICFNYKGEWIFASRGSFISEQAQMAREIAKRHSLDSLDENYTYMFEIIY